MKLRQHFRTCSLSGIFSAISKRHLNNGTYCTLFLFIKIRGWPFFPTVKMAGKKGEEKKEKTKEIRNKCAPAASESWQPRQLRCMYTCASVISGFLPRARSMVSAWLVSHIESETFGKGYACLDFNLESRPQQATNSGSPPKPKKTDKKKSNALSLSHPIRIPRECSLDEYAMNKCQDESTPHNSVQNVASDTNKGNLFLWSDARLVLFCVGIGFNYQSYKFFAETRCCYLTSMLRNYFYWVSHCGRKFRALLGNRLVPFFISYKDKWSGTCAGFLGRQN